MGWIWNGICDLLLVVKISEALYLRQRNLRVHFPVEKELAVTSVWLKN